MDSAWGLDLGLPDVLVLSSAGTSGTSAGPGKPLRTVS